MAFQSQLSFRVRPEEPEDAGAVARVNDLAFKGPAEAAIIRRLWAAGAVTLSLVAVKGEEVIGHVMFSPVEIDHDGQSITAVGLGPVAVHPDHQGQGIGTALCEAGLSRLAAAGHKIAIVLGHPTYYPRFGFEPAVQYGIRWEKDVPDEVFMVIALEDGALDGVHGVVRYHPAFDPPA
jgi:putative acetyltransferase